MFSNPSREQIKEILLNAKKIAVVGLSANPDRVSHMIARALQEAGYQIFPVNPTLSGEKVLNEQSYNSLTDIKEEIDIVNVFRRSEQTLPIAEEAAKIRTKCLWLQQGIYNEEAADYAQKHELTVIMDRCIKVEHALMGNK